MKLCFSTLGCPKLNFRDILSIAKDLGYQGIEVRGLLHVIDAPDIREFQPDKIDATKQRLNDMDLCVPVLTTACVLREEARWEETAKLAKRYVDTAVEIGANGIRLMGDDAPKPSGKSDDAIVITHLREVADYALGKGANVKLLVESNGDYAESARLARLIEDTQRDNIGVVWDLNHPVQFFGERVEHTYQNLAPYIEHVHLKDSKKNDDGTISYQMMGHGELPIKACIDLLITNGYHGFYSLEWVKRWDVSLEEPGIAFAQFANYMQQF